MRPPTRLHGGSIVKGDRLDDQSQLQRIKFLEALHEGDSYMLTHQSNHQTWYVNAVSI